MQSGQVQTGPTGRTGPKISFVNQTTKINAKYHD